MKLLITRILKLTEEQKNFLAKDNELYFFGKEEDSLSDYKDIPFDEIEGIVSFKFFITHDIKQFPNLKFVQLLSVGTDWVDLDYCAKKGIKVYNVGKSFAIPMAEWCVCKALELYKKSKTFYVQQNEHTFIQRKGVLEILGKNVLLMGYGNVGKESAVRFKAFGANVMVCNRSSVDTSNTFVDEYYPLDKRDEALKKADIICLAIPATKETTHIIGKHELEIMKDTAVIINVGRGALIDEPELIQTLQGGKLLGVALDVFEKEPPEDSNPLWNMPNVLVSPHTCFMGDGNDLRKYETLVENLKK